MPPVITLSKKAVKHLRRGHPWTFRAEISGPRDDIVPGEIVQAQDSTGKPIGLGFYNYKSMISFRIISRNDEEITPEFWQRRLQRAWDLRKGLITAETNAIRLVHAEADGIPGLIVDKYDSLLVVQLLSAGVELEQGMWCDLLQEVFAPEAILARNDQRPRELEGLPLEVCALAGEVPPALTILENGWQFRVDPWRGQKTGAFLDQRENRAAAREYATGRVLDAFCYQGWFGIQCADRATEVLAVDGSKPALEKVRANVALNGIENLKTVRANVFDFLRDADKEGQKFNLVLLDPPAFAKNRASVAAGIRGYTEINSRAMRLIPEGGILITSSCSYHLSEAQFLELLEKAGQQSGRQLQLLEKRTQGRDHPILLGHPESYYLKCFVLRVL